MQFPNRPILAIAFLLLFPSVCSQGETASFKIGAQLVQLPVPAGFFRSDGLYPAFDQALARMSGSGSLKLLAFYSDQRTHDSLAAKSPGGDGEMVLFLAGYSESDNADPSEQFFHQEALKTQEEINSMAIFKPTDLQDVKGNVDKLVELMRGQGRVQSAPRKILGLVEATASSFVFAAIKGEDTGAICALMSETRAANRIIFLFCEVPFNSSGDLKRAFSLFLPWRDEILRLNPNNGGN